MYFKHFTHEDFATMGHKLNKTPVTRNMVDEMLSLTKLPIDYKPGLSIISNNVGFNIDDDDYNLIFGKSITTDYGKGDAYSLRTWLDQAGFPVVCNVKLLREDYPELLLLDDDALCMFIYGLKHPNLAPDVRYDLRQYSEPGKDILQTAVKACNTFDSNEVNQIPFRVLYVWLRDKHHNLNDHLQLTPSA